MTGFMVTATAVDIRNNCCTGTDVRAEVVNDHWVERANRTLAVHMAVGLLADRGGADARLADHISTLARALRTRCEPGRTWSESLPVPDGVLSTDLSSELRAVWNGMRATMEVEMRPRLSGSGRGVIVTASGSPELVDGALLSELDHDSQLDPQRALEELDRSRGGLDGERDAAFLTLEPPRLVTLEARRLL